MPAPMDELKSELRNLAAAESIVDGGEAPLGGLNRYFSVPK